MFNFQLKRLNKINILFLKLKASKCGNGNACLLCE